MAYREYGVTDIVDILRRYLAGDSLSAIKRAVGTDRKTLRRYMACAREHGLGPLTTYSELDRIAHRVFREIYGRSGGRPPVQDKGLLDRKEQIKAWLDREGLTLTKVHIKLGRQGLQVPYSRLYRFARSELGFGRRRNTVRIAPSAPGEVAEVDFGRLGLVPDPSTGRSRVLHALVVTLRMSRHQYVYTTHRQGLDALIRGIEEAWAFFGGRVTRRLVIDNLKAAVVKADRFEAVFNRTFMEYARHRGFLIDPAVVRHPEGKATVERQIPYVRNNFFKGEAFRGRDHAQQEAVRWCLNTAGMRIHGTTRKRPLVVFEEEEQGQMIPLTGEPFDTPVFAEAKVHPDHHIRFGQALYGVATRYIGQTVLVRGTTKLVRIYHRGELIKTHPRVAPGQRSTDYDDYPKEKTPYAMRNCDYCIDKAKALGESIGRFAEALLEGDFPWAKLRQAQKLLRMADRYGAKRLEAACRRALNFDLINVHRLEGILRNNLKREEVDSSCSSPACVTNHPARFARTGHYFRKHPTPTEKEENRHGNHCGTQADPQEAPPVADSVDPARPSGVGKGQPELPFGVSGDRPVRRGQPKGPGGTGTKDSCRRP
jgi:transposase